MNTISPISGQSSRTRMLESWKETEANGEDEDGDDENEQGTEEQYVPTPWQTLCKRRRD